MNRNRLRWTTLVSLLALVLGLLGSAAAAQSPDYGEAWQQLKKLSGSWERDGEGLVSYHVTGGENVVWEEFIGETPDGVRDMATAYHLDVADIVATHYCGAGNQPRMRVAAWDPDQRVLRFDFLDVTHLPDPQAYYTTNIELFFESDDKVQLRFRGTTAGKQGEWMTHHLRRLTTRPHERQSGS